MLFRSVPIIIVNKIIQRFIPEADDEKKSIEITAEVLVQIIIMFLATFFIHRIITYIPTYSGENYPEFSVVNIIIVMLVIVLSLQTKLGEKVSILVERVVELWEGPKDTKKGKKGKGNVKVTQPISQNQVAMNQAVNSVGSTSISTLPPAQPTATQQQPNFDSMYQTDNTPLINASTPGEGNYGIMAANEGTGGAFGSVNW